MNDHSSLLGVVLCGGKSTRMGRDKAALPCPAPLDNLPNGNTFFSIATERFKKHSLPVAVSGNCSMAHAFTVIHDQVSDQGPMQGVLASLEHAKSHHFSACLFTPIDAPFLTDQDLSLLIDTWIQSPDLTVAFSDRIEPLIAIYPTSMIKPLKKCVAKNQLSLMKWIKEIPFQRVPMPNGSCRNINRPADLHG